MAYQLRQKERVNYRNAADIQLPRARRSTKNDKFYELEIIEEDEYTGRVKVHYIGYGTECNEWREKSDIVVTKHQEDTYIRAIPSSQWARLSDKVGFKFIEQIWPWGTDRDTIWPLPV